MPMIIRRLSLRTHSMQPAAARVPSPQPPPERSGHAPFVVGGARLTGPRRAHVLRASMGLLTLSALCTSLAGCGAREVGVEDESSADVPVSTSEAIVHGANDGDRHPAVVALIAETSEGQALCSGSLIAPDVVLTARHCVSDLKSESVSCPSRTPQITGDRDPSTITVVAGAGVSSGKPVARGKLLVLPPSSTLCDEDIALVKLDRPVTGILPLAYRGATAKVGGKVVSVGYGNNGSSGAGTRRFRTAVPVLSVTPHEFVVGESTCSGDSGGPALDEATGIILGVVSRGATPCDARGTQNIYTRVEAFAALLDQAVGQGSAPPPSTSSDGGAPAGPSDLGEACDDGASCSSGLCVTPGSAGYCSRPCGTDVGRCPTGFRCNGKTDAGTHVCLKK